MRDGDNLTLRRPSRNGHDGQGPVLELVQGPAEGRDSGGERGWSHNGSPVNGSAEVLQSVASGGKPRSAAVLASLSRGNAWQLDVLNRGVGGRDDVDGQQREVTLPHGDRRGVVTTRGPRQRRRDGGSGRTVTCAPGESHVTSPGDCSAPGPQPSWAEAPSRPGEGLQASPRRDDEPLPRRSPVLGTRLSCITEGPGPGPNPGPER